MNLIRVAAACLNQTPLAWQSNKKNIVDAINLARNKHVSILCLPELCVSGYGCEDVFLSASVHKMALSVLKGILPLTQGLIVSVGLPLEYQGNLFNAAGLLVNGRICGFVGKKFLASDGIHYEPRWFKPWPKTTSIELNIDGQSIPFGDLLFDCGGVRIGFEICEDAWVSNRPGAELATRGVDIILNPSASHFAFGKLETRKRFVLEGSRAFGVSYVYSNLLGNESGRIIYDGGAIIASNGKLVAVGERFSFSDVVLTEALIDVSATRSQRGKTGAFVVSSEPEHGPHVVGTPFEFGKISYEKTEPSLPAWEKSEHLKEEEFTRAVALGLFDYLRKSGSKAFVVSLSGGADSSAVACLVALMAQLGISELGETSFLAKLGLTKDTAASNDSKGIATGLKPHIVKSLLTCVYQATENSSDTTRKAAQTVANAIGADWMGFDIDKIVKSYVAMVEKGIHRPLTWEKDDLALQNIQARTRSPGVWMVANLRRALLLVTSNRSEAAVGYATMDGDTSGGLAPLGGIDKAFIRRWLKWLEKSGPSGLSPIGALRCVNSQAPTAELRPQRYLQTDEADLMPYDVLDSVERAFIRDKLAPGEVLEVVRAEFPNYKLPTLLGWVEKFFVLWCQNQWKRERYAPSFHLDDENLDPKTWCRFPILSGAFREELAELRQFVSKKEQA